MSEEIKWSCPCGKKTSLVIQPDNDQKLWFNLKVCWKCRRIWWWNPKDETFIELNFNKHLND